MNPTFPSIQLKKGQITDLTYKDFAEVTYGPTLKETVALENFSAMEIELMQAAAHESIKHIRVNYSPDWMAFDEFLNARGYELALLHVQHNEYPPGSFVRSLREIRDMQTVRHLLDSQQQLHYEFNPVFFQKPSEFDIDTYIADIQKTIDADRGAAYGFFDGERLAGFVSTEIQGSTLYIVELYVDTTFRGKSLGHMLMQAAFHYARLKNCASVTASLAVQNEGAVKFYEKLGFSVEWKTRFKNV